MPHATRACSSSLLMVRRFPSLVNGGASGRLEPTDSIEFYGQGLDTVGTDLRTYYLLSSTTPGLRLQLGSDLNGPPTQAQSFPLTIERKDRTIYFAGLKNGEASNWFGPIITSTPVTQSLTVTHLALAMRRSNSPCKASPITSIQQPDHQVRVLVNGRISASVVFDGQEHPVMAVSRSRRDRCWKATTRDADGHRRQQRHQLDRLCAPDLCAPVDGGQSNLALHDRRANGASRSTALVHRACA